MSDISIGLVEQARFQKHVALFVGLDQIEAVPGNTNGCARQFTFFQQITILIV